jgi:hypothetical protein
MWGAPARARLDGGPGWRGAVLARARAAHTTRLIPRRVLKRPPRHLAGSGATLPMYGVACASRVGLVQLVSRACSNSVATMLQTQQMRCSQPRVVSRAALQVTCRPVGRRVRPAAVRSWLLNAAAGSDAKRGGDECPQAISIVSQLQSPGEGPSSADSGFASSSPAPAAKPADLRLSQWRVNSAATPEAGGGGVSGPGAGRHVFFGHRMAVRRMRRCRHLQARSRSPPHHPPPAWGSCMSQQHFG